MSYGNDEHFKQLPLGFECHNNMGLDDFMVSKCNKEAFDTLNAWPAWITNGLFIYGPQGCGKSHLAHLFVDKVRKTSAAKIKISIVSAEQINSRNVKRLADENQIIVVENVYPKHNDEALFHLFNIFNENGRYMLWTAEKPSNHLHFTLPDLQTRLNMLPSIAISEPDDVMLKMLIVKLFNDRQMIIGEDILNYIMNNTRRSFAYVRDLVEEIDEISLAYQSSVNYGIVKKAIEHLNNKNMTTLDLFEDY